MFQKVILVQALTRARAVVSITGVCALRPVREDQPAPASRTLGGSAMRAALNSGPITPVAGVRRMICRPSLVIAASLSSFDKIRINVSVLRSIAPFYSMAEKLT